MKKQKFNVGDVVKLAHYVKIDTVSGDELMVSDVERKGVKFKIKGDDLLNSISSASHFSKTETVSQSEIATKLIESNGLPFTVVFTKSDKTKRTLVGRFVSHESLLGRSHVIDLEVTSGTPLRLVCHRSISSLVVDGVKYEVK